MASNDIYSNSPTPNPKQSPKRHKKRRTKKERRIITLSIILIVVSVLVVAGIGIANWRPFLDRESGELNNSIASTGADSVNFLVAGIDFEGERTARLTDVIMVVSFDVKGKKANVLQIPRDTYIGDDTLTGKINAIYSNGKKNAKYKGIDGLAEAIYDKFCIPIDHYITLDMEGFKSIVDGIGGVTVDVPKRVDWDGIVIEPGVQKLSGIEAEKFVRQRKGAGYDGSDMGRLEMQRIFMASLVDQLLNTGKGTMAKMVPDLAKYITTDLSTKEMIGIGSDVLSLPRNAIEFIMVPGESANVKTGVGNQSVYTVHKELLLQLINDKFRPYEQPITLEDIKLKELKNTTSAYDNTGGTVDGLLK